jgi:hypothetical protein
VTPTEVYGTPNTSQYCPVRDRTVIFVQNNSVWLQWVLLAAEVYLLGNRAAEKSISVLSRRGSLYRSIREIVSNPATRYSDLTISHITLAAVVEDRIGARSEAQKHLAAAKRLIHDRGDRLGRMPITTLTSFIWLGTGTSAYPDSDSLEAAIASFTHSMVAFHQWRSDLDEIFLRFGQVTSAVQSNSGALLSAYIQSRHRTFHPQSPLRPFVEAVFHDQALSQRRSHMAILWVLNRILWDLRYRYDDSINFLDRLCRLVESAGPVNLKAVTVVFMIGDCVARLGVPGAEQNHNITDIMMGIGDGDHRISWWWEVVDVVETLLLLTEVTREKLLHLLSTNLVETGANREVLTESTLTQVADEIRLSWFMARHRSV